MFKVEGIDELTSSFSQVQKSYPKEIKKFMQSEGNKLKRRTLNTAKASVGYRTGNYRKGIKRGKYYKYKNSADAIRVYAGKPAHHGHLIEYGHDMVSHKGKKVGRVKGYHIFKSAANEFESTYDADCDKFADKIAEPLNKG